VGGLDVQHKEELGQTGDDKREMIMAGVGKKDRHQWTTTLTHVAHEFHCARDILSQVSEEASGGQHPATLASDGEVSSFNDEFF